MSWRQGVSSTESLTAGAAMLVSGICVVRLLWMVARKRVRIRRPRPRPLALLRLVALAGTALTSSSATGSAAGPPRPSGPITVGSVQRPIEGRVPAPPWSASDGSSPPRPFERTEEEPSPSAGPGARSEVHGVDDEGYEVRPGDTLWDLARQVLDTDDVARIARYWPAIYRANRATIGDDPNLIRPGQLLFMPPEVRG